MIQEILGALKERSRNLIFIPFLIAFIVFNFPAFLVLSKEPDWQITLCFLKSYISENGAFEITAIPLALAFSASIIFPLISALSEFFVSRIEKFSKASRLHAEIGLTHKRAELEKLKNTMAAIQNGSLEGDSRIFFKLNGIINNHEISIIDGNRSINEREIDLIDCYQTIYEIYPFHGFNIIESHNEFFRFIQPLAAEFRLSENRERSLSTDEAEKLRRLYKKYRAVIKDELGIPEDA